MMTDDVERLIRSIILSSSPPRDQAMLLMTFRVQQQQQLLLQRLHSKHFRHVRPHVTLYDACSVTRELRLV